ncbi:hypothetical protein VNO77_08913 [Canavalia gladiata]|uniref:Amino acid transporter transmembrane domain-containing protein n=1 Tax=Canavalia gladiata TaxID=3824 RepID=A0AAN9M9N0_CANGL
MLKMRACLHGNVVGRDALDTQYTKGAQIYNKFSQVTGVETWVYPAFVGHYDGYIIANELGDSSLIRPVIWVSLAKFSIAYILTTLFGFLLFGESTQDGELANLGTDIGIPHSGVLGDILCISYDLHLVIAFPVIFFSLRFTLGLIFVVSATVNFISSKWSAFQLIGATTNVCLGFIFHEEDFGAAMIRFLETAVGGLGQTPPVFDLYYQIKLIFIGLCPHA